MSSEDNASDGLITFASTTGDQQLFINHLAYSPDTNTISIPDADTNNSLLLESDQDIVCDSNVTSMEKLIQTMSAGTIRFYVTLSGGGYPVPGVVEFPGTVAYNVGNCYDEPTSTFTAPMNGLYQFFSNVTTNAASQNRNLKFMIVKNITTNIGTMFQGTPTSNGATGRYYMSVNTYAILNQGDEVNVYNNGTAGGVGNGLIGGGETFFAGALIYAI